MPAARPWLVASLAVLLGISAPIEPSRGQEPPRPGGVQGQGTPRRPANKGRPVRRKPRPAVGMIVPYPFPPALIIRQTPEAHDEVQALLRMLRGG